MYLSSETAHVHGNTELANAQRNFADSNQHVGLFPLDNAFSYTWFPDAFAKTKRQQTTTWGQAVQDIRRPDKYPNKASQPHFKAAEFGDLITSKGCLRFEGNMGLSFAVEIDYDSGAVSISEAAERLKAAGIEAVLHSTASSAPNNPRWRAIFPLKRPCAPNERKEFVALANGALGDIAAAESFTAAQSYYLGEIVGVPYEFLHVRGNAIDDGPDLSLLPVYKTSKAQTDNKKVADDLPGPVSETALADLKSAVLAMKPERADKYLTWIETLQHLKHAEWSGMDVKELAREFSKKSAKYNGGDFEKKWLQFSGQKGHYKTIFNLAKLDGWQNPLKSHALIDMTDAGNVNALDSVTTGTLRYVRETSTWMHWCGKRWTPDPSAIHANNAALRVAANYLVKAQKMQAEANDTTEPADRKSLQKVVNSFKSWSNYCRNKRGIDAMLALSTRDARFVISQADLDKDIYLFGVNNGVVDLRTGKLRDTARDDLITKRSPYDYLPDAPAPRFKTFLDEIFGLPIDGGEATGLIQYASRPDVVRYAQIFGGYCMTGSTVEHKMFIASGSGANGKNMFLDLLGDVMGDYAGTVPVESLMASSRGSDDAERPTPFARSVAGKRLIVTSESKEGQKLDTALVKRVTGDSKLTARGMRENAFTFTTTHKIVLLTNHPPELDQADEAIKGRLHITPYSRKWNRPSLPSRNPRLHDGDKNLGEKLRAEAEGVLSWLVKGAAMYLAEGLEPPPAVAEMTNTYFAEQDSFARWMADMEVCPAVQGQTASSLFESFKSWCGSNSATFSPATQKAFASAASTRGISKVRGRSGMLYALKESHKDLF